MQYFSKLIAGSWEIRKQK